MASCVRLPLIAEYKGKYYESLSLAMFRMLAGSPTVSPGFPKERMLGRSYQGLESIQLKLGAKTLAIPVDDRVAALVPFRGLAAPRADRSGMCRPPTCCPRPCRPER